MYDRSARTACAIACGLALAMAAWAQEKPLAGIVTGVIDGDTVRVQLPEGPVTVRLAHIDAPEPIQAGGGAATRALHRRLLAREVSLQVVSGVPDERLVAVVLLDGEDINGWMVKQGHAWAYRRHNGVADYCIWENAARSLRRGIWAEKYWVAPWDWREARRDSLYFVTDYSHNSTAGCIREIGDAAILDD